MTRPTKQDKIRIFGYYWSGICPACARYKNPLHWLCIPCSERSGSEEQPTEAWRALDKACAEHCRAAEAFIAAGK